MERFPRTIVVVCLAMVATHFAVDGQDNIQPPRLVQRDGTPAVQNLPRNLQLERRFLESTEWSFFHRVEDLPDSIRDVLYKATSPSIVNAGESFDSGDIRMYGSSHQSLFSASTSTLWLLVWYSGGFNGPTLRALIYDPEVRDGYQYDFGSAVGGVSLDPELKALINANRPETTRKYHATGSL